MENLIQQIRQYQSEIEDEDYLIPFFSAQSALEVIEILRVNRMPIFGIDCYTVVNNRIRCLHDEKALGLYYDWSCDGDTECWNNAKNTIIKILSYPEIKKINILFDLVYVVNQ